MLMGWDRAGPGLNITALALIAGLVWSFSAATGRAGSGLGGPRLLDCWLSCWSWPWVLCHPVKRLKTGKSCQYLKLDQTWTSLCPTKPPQIKEVIWTLSHTLITGSWDLDLPFTGLIQIDLSKFQFYYSWSRDENCLPHGVVPITKGEN